MTTLKTERLLMRPWRDADYEPFARINADPRAMEHFPAPLDRASSDRIAGLIRRFLEENGYGLWAVEVPGVAPFIGFVGLSDPHFEAPFMPAVEVGWRLHPDHWGHGYATEAARRAVAYGFEELGLDEVVSFTTPANRPSIAVMERLGMTRDPAEDFDHPRVPAGDPLRRHVLYRLPSPNRRPR